LVAVATLALLTSRVKNDGQGLAILCACYCNMLLHYSVSTALRFIGRKWNFYVSAEVSVNE
jgi:hypothetical protein